MLLQRKQLFTPIQEPEFSSNGIKKRVVKRVPYMNSESIQEEEEHSSSQLFCLKPAFLQTYPQQPIDLQSSDDVKAPTVVIATPESHDIHLQGKKHTVHDESFLSSKQALSSQLLSDKKPNKTSQYIQVIKQKFLNSIHYFKYNDPLITHEESEVSSALYHYFTIFLFFATIFANFITVIFVPLLKCFDYPTQKQLYIIFGIKGFMIICDLYFQRGPYKIIRGKVITNYREVKKISLDFFRLGVLVINVFMELDDRAFKVFFFLLIMSADFVRSCEKFENIYRSTQYTVIILQMWVTIVISLTCLLKIFDENKNESVVSYLAFSLSLLTHTGNISIEVSDANSIILSVYLILSYACILYTSIIIFVWIKPEMEIIEEKEKLLKGFITHFREKCQNEDLLRRCYSYLEFRIDEDLARTKEQLTKKLSPALQDEVDLSLRSIMLEKIQLMNKFSLPFKHQLLFMIEQVTFNPEDEIIIEHQLDDIALYYILKGEVKVQFQGSSLANNKRSVTKLQEGNTFGQYSFISGFPSNVSIFSCGVTTLMKIRRSDFLDIISYYPDDNELFSMMRDNSYYNHHVFECQYCKIRGHYILECQHIQYFPQRANVLEKYLFSINQERKKYFRKETKYLTLKNLSQNQEKAKQVIKKYSQDINSDDLPEASQLPYSENQIYSVSYVSNSGPFQKQSQEQQISNSNVNVESLDNMTSEIEQEDIQVPAQVQPFRKNRQGSTNIASNRTAGFLNNQDPFASPYSQIEQVDVDGQEESQFKEEIVTTTQKASLLLPTPNRVMPNKLTFQYQRDNSHQSTFKQDVVRQDSNIHGNNPQEKRQPSIRSHTYTNSLSKDISNNPSSNSRQNKSLKQSCYSKENAKKSNSDHSHSDQNKTKQKSQKSGTKQSNPNQASQFQALTTPDNSDYQNDIIFNKFDKMYKFKIYFPHNNYDQVLGRCLSQKKKKQVTSPYSIRCVVASKIKKVQRLLKNREKLPF